MGKLNENDIVKRHWLVFNLPRPKSESSRSTDAVTDMTNAGSRFIFIRESRRRDGSPFRLWSLAGRNISLRPTAIPSCRGPLLTKARLKLPPCSTLPSGGTRSRPLLPSSETPQKQKRFSMIDPSGVQKRTRRTSPIQRSLSRTHSCSSSLLLPFPASSGATAISQRQQ